MRYNQPFGHADPDASYVDQNTPGAVAGSAVPAAAVEFPQREIVAAVAAAGMTPANEDLEQLAQAMTRTASGGVFYIDSGTADAYVLAIVGDFVAPSAYFDGMEINFVPDNDNTGASTVNVAGLGVKDLVNSSGGALALGDISTLVTARYDAGLDKFKLQPWSRPEIGTYLLVYNDLGFSLPYDTWTVLSGTIQRNTLGATFSSGVFTAPRRGLYQFRMRASLLDNPSFTGTKWMASIDATGAPTSPFGASDTLWRTMGYDVSTIGFGYCGLSGGGELEMDAGETAKVRVRFRDGGGSGSRALSNINMTIALLS